MRSISYCRICHEDEFEDSLDVPCACSGTSKFAHKKCIQRWCCEKGNTTCEICLQNYRPGYSIYPEIDHVIEEVFIRELPIQNWDREYLENGREDEEDATRVFVRGFSDSSEDGPATCCRSVAVIFIVLLLLKHIFAVLLGEAWKLLNTFTMSVVRSCGYIIPMYLIIWAMFTIQSILQKYHSRQQDEQLQPIRYNRDRVDEQILHITVDI